MTRPTPASRRIVLALFAIIALGRPTESTADCPQSFATCDYCPAAMWTAAFKDTVVQAEGLGAPFAHARGDWIGDTLYAHFGAGFESFSGSFHASEGFQIIGLPAGQPVLCTVTMKVQGYAYAAWSDDPTHAYGSASIEIVGSAGANTSRSSSCSGYSCQSSGTLTTTLTTSAQVAAGTPFAVRAIFQGSGGGNVLNPAEVSIGARLSFQLQSAGSSIVSCHGYTPTVVLAVGPQSHTGLRIRGSWPNPARGAFGVTVETAGQGPATLTLLDILGREVERSRWDAPGMGVCVATMNRGGRLAPGTYVLRLTQGAVADAKVITLLR